MLPQTTHGFKAASIRTFIGAQNFELSRSFYQALGFVESVISTKMSYFRVEAEMGFYLQDYYVKDWCDNSMVFLEVADVEDCWSRLCGLELAERFPPARLSPIKELDWGSECFLHDPAGVLWHFGQFNQ